jgi:hypothetical protein
MLNFFGAQEKLNSLLKFNVFVANLPHIGILYGIEKIDSTATIIHRIHKKCFMNSIF